MLNITRYLTHFRGTYLIADLTKDGKYTSLRYAADLTPWRIARDLSIYIVHSLHRKKEDKIHPLIPFINEQIRIFCRFNIHVAVICSHFDNQ